MINANYYLNQDFQDKISFYMTKAAIAVMAELDTTANHVNRVAYAEDILAADVSINAYAQGVSTNATIKTKIDNEEDYDSDLEFVVNSLFDAYAGGVV